MAAHRLGAATQVGKFQTVTVLLSGFKANVIFSIALQKARG
jgi:hypothetical protein